MFFYDNKQIKIKHENFSNNKKFQDIILIF